MWLILNCCFISLAQSGLPPQTLRALDDVFEGTYMSKYPVVGYMDYLLENRPELFSSMPYSRYEHSEL